ncbi:MAG: alpha/beta fold hydrolase [Nevskiaceae bacterium]
MNAARIPGARRIAFRFGLTGRRWGDAGPVVLMLHGGDAPPWVLAQLIEPLVAAGRQVIALDDPTEASADDAARIGEYGNAAVEAAVELRSLESVVGHGLGAAAAATALALGLPAERSVMLGAGTATNTEEILDSLLDRKALRLAA